MKYNFTLVDAGLFYSVIETAKHGFVFEIMNVIEVLESEATDECSKHRNIKLHRNIELIMLGLEIGIAFSRITLMSPINQSTLVVKINVGKSMFFDMQDVRYTTIRSIKEYF